MFSISPISIKRFRGVALARTLPVLLAFSGALLLASARPAHADEWALLIGIDQYEDTNHINSLGGASADARAIAMTVHDQSSRVLSAIAENVRQAVQP